MSKYTFILIIIILGALGGLIWLAVKGSNVAIFTMGILTGVTLITLGVLLTILVTRAGDRRRQAEVNHNLQETLAYVAQMQKVQSAQFRNQNYLPAPGPAESFNLDAHLQYDEGVFSSLDTGTQEPDNV